MKHLKRYNEGFYDETIQKFTREWNEKFQNDIKDILSELTDEFEYDTFERSEYRMTHIGYQFVFDTGQMKNIIEKYFVVLSGILNFEQEIGMLHCGVDFREVIYSNYNHIDLPSIKALDKSSINKFISSIKDIDKMHGQLSLVVKG